MVLAIFGFEDVGAGFERLHQSGDGALGDRAGGAEKLAEKVRER